MFIEVALEKAQEILLSHVKGGLRERKSSPELLNKVLAEDIVAPLNVPQFRKSPLDGFAYSSLDTKGASPANPIEIMIIDEVQAGDTRLLERLAPGWGVKILTGAPLPPNADIVIKKEEVNLINNKITITEELQENTNVIFLGSDIKMGDCIFAKGEILGPYHIGVLAALGLTSVLVYQAPQVALISIGNELKEPGAELQSGQIYNSNLYSLQALVRSLGGNPINLGIISDDQQAIQGKILAALNKWDLVITTGGASVGDYDLIEQSLRGAGAKILFNRVAIKPGSPIVAGLKDDKLVIGLSGNPAAALISFELLVRPFLRKFQGIKELTNKYIDTILVDGFSKKSTQRRFLRVRITYENEKWVAYQTGKQQSSILRSMVGCNALIDIPKGSGPIKPGAKVKALILKEELAWYPQ